MKRENEFFKQERTERETSLGRHFFPAALLGKQKKKNEGRISLGQNGRAGGEEGALHPDTGLQGVDGSRR